MNNLRTIIIGLGQLGKSVINDINNGSNLNIELICALDDDISTYSFATSNGIKFVDNVNTLENKIDELNIQQIIIAITNANKRFINDLIYRSLRKEVRTVCLNEEYNNIYNIDHFNIPISMDYIHQSEVIENKVFQSSDNNKKVLVTGGAGYIGNHLVRDLLNDGYNVIVLDNFSFGSNSLNDIIDNERLTLIEGNIENIRDIFRSVNNVNYVIALAAIVGDPACGIDIEDTMIVNYESTKILVEACNYFGVEKLVFASSCSVYGATIDGNLLDENSKLNPVSLYARTRIFSENYILDNAINFSPTILRLSTVFGYSDRMRFDLVVNLFAIKALIENKIEIFGGNQWRPFVHCKDVAKAFKLVIETDNKIVRNKIYNVGNESLNFTIEQISNLVKEILPNTIIKNNGEIDDPRNYKVSFSKIQRDLKFIPEYNIVSGIKEILENVVKKPFLKSYKNEIFSNYLTFKK